MLSLTRTGQARPGTPPVVVAHGLFGSKRNWGAVAKQLAEHRQIVSVDMRNHGESFSHEDHDYPAMAADLAKVIEAEGAPAALLGHSMGGKAAMRLALERRDLVDRLIVVDMAPVAYGHSLAEFVRAMQSVDVSAVRTRKDADAFLAEHIDDPGIRMFLLQSLDVRGEGWQLNLDVLEAEMGTIMGWPEIEGSYDGPALFLHGGASDYVAPEHHDAVRRYFPQAELREIPGAGHWMHAEKPQEVADEIARFLNQS